MSRSLKRSHWALLSAQGSQQFSLSGEVRGGGSVFSWMEWGGKVKCPLLPTNHHLLPNHPFSNELWLTADRRYEKPGRCSRVMQPLLESILWDCVKSSSAAHVSCYQLLSSFDALGVILRKIGKVSSILLRIHLFTVNWVSMIHQARCCVLRLIWGWWEGYKLELCSLLNS